MAIFNAYHKWLGIPPEEQPPNHYRLLGIEEFEVDADVIEAGAEQRTVFLRSFQRGSNPELAKRFLQEISKARSCLLDVKRKARYDQRLKQSQQPTPVSVPTPVIAEEQGVQSQEDSAHQPVRWFQTLWAGAVGGAVVMLLMMLASSSDKQTSGENPDEQRQGKIAGEVVASGKGKAGSTLPVQQQFSVPKISYEYKVYQWSNGMKPVRMIHKDEGFCFLFLVHGLNHRYAEAVNLGFDNEGYWILRGDTHRAQPYLRAQAVAVKIILNNESRDAESTSQPPPAEKNKKPLTAKAASK